MNASVFRRLVWKEYRVMRGFWLALAAFAGMCFLGVWCFAERTEGLILGMWSVAALVPALYALGCGATLFAVEREEETYEFLRTLPCTSAQVFIGKLALALASTLALIALLVFVAASGAGWQSPREGLIEELAVVWGVGMVEALVWGTFYSLLTRRPLQAAVLAAATAISVPSVIGLNVLDHGQFAAVARWRLCVAAAVFLVDVWLGVRWLRAPSRRRRRFAQWTGAVTRWWSVRAARAVAAKRRRLREPGWLTSFGRLVWHEGRQARALGLTLAGAAAVLIFAPRSDPDMFALALLPLALMGGCVFQADQRGENFRFFAERGISPRTVWLSRQTVWLTMLLLTPPLLMFVDLCIVWQAWQAVTPINFHASENLWVRSLVENLRLVGLRMDIDASHRAQYLRLNFDSSNLVGAGLVLAMTYSAGQLASMYIRRGIIACFGGLWLAGMLFAWAGLMLKIGAPWPWSIAPIPLVLLFATWLRAPDWLLERKDWRARTRAAASLLVPTSAMFAAVAVFRVVEVPSAPSPTVEFESPATPEALETAAMYRRAADQLAAARRAGWTQDAVSFEPIEPAMALAVEASRRESCAMDLSGWLDPSGDYDRASDLATLIRSHARELQRDGKLDDALSRYMAVLRITHHLRQQPRLFAVVSPVELERGILKELPAWAGSQGQTPERIRGAIGELAGIFDRLPSPLLALEGEFDWIRRLIDSDSKTWPGQTDQERWIIAVARWWMPWERARMRRLLDRMSADDRAGLSRVLTALKGNQAVLPVLQFAHDKRTTDCLRTTLLVADVENCGGTLAWLECELETRRRATRLVLALVAHRLEHGTLPDVLSEVSPEGDLRDPYTGEPFLYAPKGVVHDLVIGVGAGVQTIAADVPLVLSQGPVSPAFDRYPHDEYNAFLVERLPADARGNTQIGRAALFFPLPAEP
ncbi:MAG TPA: hypothetical protein VND64_36155 [Pirellulales bacterium]|nr:hypothetical protein [Pirellulales bacterium]